MRVAFFVLAAALLAASPARGAPAARRVLFVMPGSESFVDATAGAVASGFWPTDFAVPYRALKRAGAAVVVATPRGRPPRPIIKREALPEGSPDVRTSRAAPELRRPAALESLGERDLEGFDAVFVPGGYGALTLAQEPGVARVLRHFHDKGKPTALVCFGPSALLGADDGPWPYAGYAMTGQTDGEVRSLRARKAPLEFSLKRRLRGRGGRYSSGPDFKPYVVEDRELLTGQNPASAGRLAALLLRKLGLGAARP